MLSRGTEAGQQPERNYPYGRIETRDLARGHHRRLCGPGTLVCLRAQPFDPFRISLLLSSLLWSEGIGGRTQPAARCPCCNFVYADARHARLCPRAGAQVAQHQSLIHTMSRILRLLFIAHTVEGGASFLADPDVRMDVVIPGGRALRRLDFGELLQGSFN